MRFYPAEAYICSSGEDKNEQMKIISNQGECYVVGDGSKNGLRGGVRDSFMLEGWGGLCDELTFEWILEP